MPIAQFPQSAGPGPGVSGQLVVKPPLAVPDPAPPTPILPGHAVALVDVAGTPTYKLCGAEPVDRPDLFIGFVYSLSVVAGASEIVTGRGSTVTPIVEGGVPLVVNQNVFLSRTPGEVTQTAPIGPTDVMILIGFATSTTNIALMMDFRILFP